MTVEPGPAGPGSRLARQVAGTLLSRLDEVTDALVTDILAENPGYHDAAMVSSGELRHSCRENLERVLQLLGGTAPPGDDAYDAAVATGSRRAEQRVPLDAVLRSYRLGGRVIWRAVVAMVKQDGSIAHDQVLDVATSVWTVVDEVSSAVGTAYRRTELQLRRLDDHRRHALVLDLLSGRGREAGFAQPAATELGLPADSGYLVVVAELAADGTPGLATPQDALAAHGIRSVWELRDQTLVGLVALERCTAAKIVGLLRDGVRARVGAAPPVRGLAEVGSGYELALLALGTVPPGHAELAELDEHLPAALVTRSPELARRLVDGVLGPVRRLPPGERDVLLDTLAAWLESNLAVVTTAERLFCHRNTVLNRLRRLESVLGRSVHDHESCLTLSLALVALRTADPDDPRDDQDAQRDTPVSGHPA